MPQLAEQQQQYSQQRSETSLHILPDLVPEPSNDKVWAASTYQKEFAKKPAVVRSYLEEGRARFLKKVAPFVEELILDGNTILIKYDSTVLVNDQYYKIDKTKLNYDGGKEWQKNSRGITDTAAKTAHLLSWHGIGAATVGALFENGYTRINTYRDLNDDEDVKELTSVVAEINQNITAFRNQPEKVSFSPGL